MTKRFEVIVCDICNKYHEATHRLPLEWITTIRYIPQYGQEEFHFCSRECLITMWSIPKKDAKGEKQAFSAQNATIKAVNLDGKEISRSLQNVTLYGRVTGEVQ